MANTGVIHRRGLKAKLNVNRPLRGEIVYAMDTDEFGALVNGEMIWKKFLSEVLSVSGKTGHVILDKADVGLENVDNTSDIDKPISALTQTALDNIETGTTNLNKYSVGLGNVDNTSDMDKPASTAVVDLLFTKLDKIAPSIDTQNVNGIPSADMASKAYVYDRPTIDTKLDTKANVSNVYSIGETNDRLNLKADIDSVYTKVESNDFFEAKVHKSQPDGYASLDLSGKVPYIELPTMGTEDYATVYEFPITGRANTLYVDKTNNSIYRFDIVTSTYNIVGSAASGSGSDEYIRTDPMRITVGGAVIGTIFTGTIADALDKILYPYISPIFASFASDIPLILEIGYALPAGVYGFYWTTTESQNVKPNSITISEGGIPLASNLANLGQEMISLPEITKNIVSTQIYTIRAENTNNIAFSRDLIIQWNAQVLYGSNLSTAITDPEIRNLSFEKLASNALGNYIMPPDGYKWICYPVSFGLASNFKDPSTGFNIAMEPSTIVSYTTDMGLVLDYYCYRTTNQMAGGINITIE